MADPFSSDAAPSILQGFATLAGRIDPHPTWHRLRAVAPVYRQPSGDLLVTGHAEVLGILTDGRWLSIGDVAVAEAKASGRPDKTSCEHAALLEPVDMAVLRPVVNRVFSTRALAPYRERVAGVVGELIDALEGRREIDLVADFTRRLPFAVVGDLLGFPQGERLSLLDWAKAAGVIGPPPADEDADTLPCRMATEFANRLDPLIEWHGGRAGDDLLSDLIGAFDESDLDTNELRRAVLAVVLAGADTTTNFAANAVYALLRHPEELARLIDDPSLLPSAIEEILRWIGSVKAIRRVASEDVVLRGELVPAGTTAGLSLAAANRDPSVFSDPDRFDIGRRPNPHLALAKGVHYCLGAALIRIVAQESTWQFFDRFPDAVIVEDGVRYHDTFGTALVSVLPLRLIP